MKTEEEFYGLIEELKQNNTAVIVEGRKDAFALQEFGLKNTIELSKKPLFAVVEQISGSCKECVILTDLDKKGKELYGKLSSDLQFRGVKINNKLRNFLFKRTKIRQIEGIQLGKLNGQSFSFKENVDRKLFK